MADASVIQLLASGLFGAAVTASLNHFVRRYEAHREKRKQENRAAYVLMARISPFIVIQDVLNRFHVAYAASFASFQQCLKDSFPISSNFDLAEVFATVLCEASKLEKPLIDPKDLSVLVGLAAGEGENWKQFDLSIDQQAKFPKEAILHIALLIQSEQYFLEALRQLKSASANPKSLIPQHLLNVWNSVKDLIKYSELAFSDLKRFGNISDEEAVAILVRQRTRVTAPFDNFLNNNKQKASDELAELISSRLKEFTANKHKQEQNT